MSGILLPGQEKKPDSGESGKIEIAQGFSRARDRRADASADAESTAASADAPVEVPDAAAAPPRAQGRGGRPELAFPPMGAQVQCPGCGTPYTVPVFTILDLGANPELRQALLGGQINVAACPNCGMGGPLSSPLLVHDPENTFLGVFVPPTGMRDDMQSQRAIGDLTQTLMRKLPTEARKGYLLQPKQFSDWDRFMEVLWEFEGVTPEMLRRQRDQSMLLQRLVGLANDRKALEMALQRDKALVDDEFFAMLDRILMMAGNDPQVAPFLELRQNLLDMTDAGAVVKAREAKARALLERIDEGSSRTDVLDILIEAWTDPEDGEALGSSLVVALSPAIDYQFLVELAARIEEAEGERKASLEELRDLLVTVQEQQRQSRASMAQQSQALLQEVLQATDVNAKLREFADYLDEDFMGLLASNIQAAQQKNATAAVRRLTEIYQAAMTILQESMPADLRLLNQLLAAPDMNAARALLKENRDMVNREFLESVSRLEGEMRNNQRTELADRLKALRGQIALMM